MTQFLQRRLAITAPALAALAFLTLPAAQAAGYPDHPVTVVVPYPPGGGADIFGRAIAHALEPGLKQTVLVENKPGAGGNIGMAYVARAKPDGYTLGLGTIGTQTINQFLYNNMAFDPERDLVPIALVSTTPNVIAVSAKSPYKTVADVIKAAQQSKDKKLTYASPGIGSSVHLTGAYFEAMAGVTMLHVPFKGTSASLPAVAGGQVDLLFDNLPGALAQIKDGNLVRGVAVTSAARDASLPTVAESGLPGFDVTAWFALYAPRNTPEPVVKQLIEAARSGLKNPAVAANFAGMGAKPGTLFGADLAAFEAGERKKWGGLIKDKGITAQ
jgi:tripartite-type tricarboxylate transporter receptor subunit TctC